MHVGLGSTASDKITSSSKSENSLHELTRRFLKLIDDTFDKTIDLNTAAYLLNVSKRRVYDITNVLEGLDLLQKTHVNNVRWTGGEIKAYIPSEDLSSEASVGESCSEPCDAPHTEEEQRLEAEIAAADKALDLLYEEMGRLSLSDRNIANAYVTHNDLQGLDILKNRLVFAVRMPESVKIEIPEAGLIRHNELNIMSGGERIDVFHIQRKE